MPRKRLPGKARYQNGRIKNTKEARRDEDDTPAGIVRRIIADAKRGAANPLLGSEIGILRLTKRLTDIHVAAGTELGELVGRYDAMKGLGSRHMKSPSYQTGFGLSLRADPNIEEVRKVEARYQGAMACMGRYAPYVISVVVYDRPSVTEEGRLYVRAGLDLLADYFGLSA